MTDLIGGCFRKLTGICTKSDAGPFLSAEEVLSEAKKADLIEFKYDNCFHWGLYVGDNNVIHLSNIGNGKGRVQEDLLVDVAEGKKCRINNKEKEFKANQSADEVISYASKWLYESDKLDIEYGVLGANCEHICMKWKYGISNSEQIENAAKIIAGTAAAVGITATAAAVGVVVADEAKKAAEEEAKAELDRKRQEEQEKAKEKLKFW